MEYERKAFLLNREQKILVFFSWNSNYPKIILPNLLEEKKVIKLSISKNLEDYELVTSFDRTVLFTESENNHLVKKYRTLKVEYYATLFNLTDELRKEIREMCEENNLYVDFLSIREIQDALDYLKKENPRRNNDKEISLSLRRLKRKIKYREY